MGTYIKAIHILISIVSALTVGVILSVFIGAVSLLQAFMQFPIQVYRNLQQQERARRLSQVFTPTHTEPKAIPEEENIWDKHIRRMEQKKKHNSNHE